MRRRLGLEFVRSSYTLDQNLGVVCDYAAAYPETHYKNKKCAVRSALCAASALCAEPEHSTVGGSKKINIESIAIAIGHRNYRNATAMLSKRQALKHPKAQSVLWHYSYCSLATWRMLGQSDA